jgi:uncharacterized protein YyaL (SSP411 family)
MKISTLITGICTLLAFVIAIMLATGKYLHSSFTQTSAHNGSMNTSSTFVEEQLKLGKKSNRLVHEKSPYLLQHAFNPVDWYPWGEEAFKKANDEDKPIFLSIGYSTCYWCHVMEREVFEDTAIARLMNEHLVCIKVDREERPDIDRVYMTAVQAISGSGGWPMSVFMTPDRKPFFGGTYIPPKAQYGRPGFPDLVKRIDELWHNERNKITESSNQIIEMLQTHSASHSSAGISDSVLHTAYNQLLQNYDHAHAGFGGAPKFPRPVVLNFLLRYYSRTGADSALQMTLATLRAMAKGGMNDQIGGGFHRYSVDGQWRIPHFEKMLYDQAQLVNSYLEAYQITRDETFAVVARNILDYVLRNLTDAEGGFYSAEDAESALDAATPEKKEEGEFYLWKRSETDDLLGMGIGSIVNYAYGILDSGNAPSDPMGVFLGKNILFASHTIEETAEHVKKTPGEVGKILADARQKLFERREQRPRPHLDDKIITAWNGLMISAFANAYQLLGESKYLEAGTRSARFIMTHLYDPNTHRLLRRYRDGEARFDGGLQDYAFLTMGLIDLYEASFDTRWLNDAIDLTQYQLVAFWDSTDGGFFDITGNDPTILMKTKEDYDGAEPTGNSIAAWNLLRLSQMTDNRDWRMKAEKTISAFGARLQRYPEVLAQMLVAVDWVLSTPKEIVIAGNPDSADTKTLLAEVHKHFIPNNVLLLVNGGEQQKRLSSLLQFTTDMKPLHGKAAAYICENYACQLPTSDPAVVATLLTKSHKK